MFKILYIVLILFSKTQSAQRYKKIIEYANFSKECANFSKEKHKKGNLPLQKQQIVTNVWQNLLLLSAHAATILPRKSRTHDTPLSRK